MVNPDESMDHDHFFFLMVMLNEIMKLFFFLMFFWMVIVKDVAMYSTRRDEFGGL